ncbi:MAG: DNA helicase [Spirochaetes bacterium GWF1_51_8]|nr:MAG: DNA helicase [Spirochaetes bacterium GWF1_51_8]
MNKTNTNPNEPIDNLAIGKIIEVDGTHIIAELNPNLFELSCIHAGEAYPIGQFGSMVKVHFGRRIIYALVGRLRMKSEFQAERGMITNASTDERVIEADLFGEGEWLYNSSNKRELEFERGVSSFPLPMQNLYLTPKQELRLIFGNKKDDVIQIGYHVGTGKSPCYANINELLGKHTAVLGSTGSGKSGTVAAIIHSILEKGSIDKYTKWKPRIIILDPHGEYGNAFKNHKILSSDDDSLLLPYWLLNLQETCSLLIGKTEYVATSQTNIVKKALILAREEGARIIGLDPKKINVDSPIPYKISTVQAKIEEDKPEQASKQDSHNSILRKLEIYKDDARYKFMMNEWSGEKDDPFPELIKLLIADDYQPRIIDLSGVPNEVAGIISSVIGRTLFSFKVWQNQKERESDPLLLVCEEAHRYVPNRGEAQYEAAQEAIRRIAKEGRKYGLGLLLVSQRPSEVEATVLSQCNSWIVHRITNDADREHVRLILPDSMSGMTKMLSGLRKQEAIFVGQATMIPSRIMIRNLNTNQLPKSNDIDFNTGWQNEIMPIGKISEVVNRWRYQQK